MPTQPDASTPLEHARIPSLDGLRAVAVLMVLAAHASRTDGFPANAHCRAWALRGVIGVDLFFVISGFLITTLLLREMARSSGVIDVKSFYLRRVLRIVPAHAFFLLTLLALHASTRMALQRRDWVGAITYTINFLDHPTWEVGHLWSLSVEEHFYLLWPIVLTLGGVAGARRLCWGLVIGCLLARSFVVVLSPRSMPLIEFWTPIRIDTIAFGCLLAMLAQDVRFRQRIERCARSRLLVFVALVLLAGSVQLFSRFVHYQAPGYTINGALLTFLTWAAIRRGQRAAGGLLNHGWMIAIGTGSYSLYLWQQIFLRPGGHDWARQFPQNLLLAWLAARISYRCIERPCLRLKQKVVTGLHPWRTERFRFFEARVAHHA
jgi:peptidoglycan/LPS O-acetylase OafA/YrhL